VVEGSAFKSKFANALTTMIIGCLGTAAAENKLAVGYGAEAGFMDPLVEKMCARYCKDSLIITRNEQSRTRLRQLGVPAELGTDTAWTFQPLPPEYGRQVLAKLGWDGRLPVLIVCPINPFWWPVKPSLAKYAALALTGAYRESHYRSVYFHRSGHEIEAALERYLTSMANAVRAFSQRHKIFTVLVATEQLDARACHRIAEKLGGAPVATSAEYDMYQMVSLLRAGHLMVSSRFHGIVTSMPALVPSAGVTMDERIRNLMSERGHLDLLMEVDDPELEPKLFAALERLASDGQQIADGIGSTVVKNLKTMARMGVYFEEELRRRYPDFPTRTGRWGWEDYLPPLDPGLERLLGMYS
jgi:polysaccharide pyruvyl transferase WcaK-like protein